VLKGDKGFKVLQVLLKGY
jgi:hypothetical protein